VALDRGGGVIAGEVLGMSSGQGAIELLAAGEGRAVAEEVARRSPALK